MKNILIGSRALQYWYPDAKISREDSDWDIISDTLNLDTLAGNRTEIHKNSFLYGEELNKYCSNKCLIVDGVELHIMSLEGLALIKRSHLWRALNFSKHMTHYAKYLAKHLPTDLRSVELLQARTKLTMQLYPQGYPKLNKTVKDFFNDAVVKKYDHDMLHQLVAYQRQPLYTRLQKDATMATCHLDLWMKLTDKEKTLCVAEEVQVIAIERFMVPSDWKHSSRLAYLKALEKVCTTLCSGWFRDWAIDHYEHLTDLYSSARMQEIKIQLERIDNEIND